MVGQRGDDVEADLPGVDGELGGVGRAALDGRRRADVGLERPLGSVGEAGQDGAELVERAEIDLQGRERVGSDAHEALRPDVVDGVGDDAEVDGDGEVGGRARGQVRHRTGDGMGLAGIGGAAEAGRGGEDRGEVDVGGEGHAGGGDGDAGQRRPVLDEGLGAAEGHVAREHILDQGTDLLADEVLRDAAGELERVLLDEPVDAIHQTGLGAV